MTRKYGLITVHPILTGRKDLTDGAVVTSKTEISYEKMVRQPPEPSIAIICKLSLFDIDIVSEHQNSNT